MSNSNSFTYTPCNHHIHEEGPEDKVPLLFVYLSAKEHNAGQRPAPFMLSNGYTKVCAHPVSHLNIEVHGEYHTDVHVSTS